MTMATRTRRRGALIATGLPPVPVACRACGHEWTSTAKHQTSIRCPACGHGVRVKRYPAGTEHEPTAPPPQVAAQAQPVAAALPEPQPLPGPDDGDDDGTTWIRDASGTLVLAEWTRDGQLVPAPPVRACLAGLAARHWEIGPNPAGAARCGVVLPPPPGAPDGTPPRHCLGLARYDIPGGAVCEACMDAISRPLAY